MWSSFYFAWAIYGQFQKASEAGFVVKKAREVAPKLTIEQSALLAEWLSKGGEHYGFEGEVWTRSCVGEVIKQCFGVNYEVSTIGLLLKQLGLMLQKPKRRDYRQNPQHVEQWREETWPELKKPLWQRTDWFFM